MAEHEEGASPQDQTPTPDPTPAQGETPVSGATRPPPMPPAGAELPRGFAADIFQTRYREVTISAILFAIVIGVIMNAAITYAGLKIGFTLSGSAIAAVLAFGVLRGILRKGSILETNIAQTIASAVNTSNSGIIFTVPVLFLVGYELTFGDTNFWLITLACIAGALLGTAFIIPLRKQMLDIERLRFPSPTGVATILKSPGAGPAKAVVLLAGCLIGAAIYLPVGLPSITRPAEVDQLDDLFDRGKIAHGDRQRTIAIAGWIEQEAAPEPILERGRLMAQLREAQQRYDELTEPRILRTEEPERRLESLRRAREASDAVAQLEAMLAEHKQSEVVVFETEPDRTGGVDPRLFSDQLARRAYEASQGESPWSALRDRDYGWAAVGFFGYSDLDWRLPPEEMVDAEPIDLNGDGEPDTVLTFRVDHNRDGRPDLILTDQSIDLGRLIGLPAEFQLVFAIAPFALGAGYITGKAGLFVLAGGILAYFVLNPIAFNLGWLPTSVKAHEAPDVAFHAFNRPIGIGLLLGGALMGVIFSLPAIREAIKSIASASKIKGGGDELGLKTLVVAIIAAFLFLFVAADLAGNMPMNTTCPVTQEEVSTEIPTADFEGYAIGFAFTEAALEWEQWDESQRQAFLESQNARPGWFAGLDSHVRAALIAIIGAVWIWFAGIIIAQCSGMTDWSPISGLALLTVILVLLLAGTGAVVGAVLVGAALCVAITLAADMMGDMKTGYLVGSKPKRQQVVELCVVWIGPIVCMFTLMLIVQANIQQFGIPIGPGTDTSAPQAQALQAVITGVQGGEMPYLLYGLGALLGCLLGLGAFPGLGVLVGLSIYLPFIFIATYGVGCVINMIVQKVKGKAWSEAWGVPFAAGLIVGEAILALVINSIILVGA